MCDKMQGPINPLTMVEEPHVTYGSLGRVQIYCRSYIVPMHISHGCFVEFYLPLAGVTSRPNNLSFPEIYHYSLGYTSKS